MYIGKSVKKIDADALLAGKGVYTDDIAPKECLVIKLLRSPHANAIIKNIDVTRALAVEGVECVLTYKDVPQSRFCIAGQSYPQPSPYDRLILDKKVRYVGDEVAIIAAVDEKTAIKAMGLIKVTYDVLEPILDFENALDNKNVIHDESDYRNNFPIGGDQMRNLCASGGFTKGDMDKEMAQCDYTLERTYYTKANAQAMMETFRTFTFFDYNGRLNVVSSTQTPFHARRVVANALEISPQMIKVIKPRIGGGFGAKQTLVSEVYPAIVTMKTGKPAKIVYDRYETFAASNSRHQMRIKIRLGCDKAGNILAAEVDTLSNTGAYGEHASTTVGLSGTKTLSLCNNAKAINFKYNVVYSNTMPAGAFRGYGATQGFFAMESAINEMASIIGIDPVEMRKINMIKSGDVMFAYHNETLSSCGLLECVEKGAKMIGYKAGELKKDMGNGVYRGIGVATCLQGSGITHLDTATVYLKLDELGGYTLMIGATDMGTGCDTILCQMAAEMLMCKMENITVHGVDTDVSPYDTGSYASSTTYVTGNALVECATKLIDDIKREGARLLETDCNSVDFDGEYVYELNGDKKILLKDLAVEIAAGKGTALSQTGTYVPSISPPPFMAGFAEIEVDTKTGKITPIKMYSAIDCGTRINENLARIQGEGGLAQGMGMALYEDVLYNKNGKMVNNSFLNYKIPSREDVGEIKVEFADVYEKTGPYGAKSIGEVVINTPSPAIAHALFNATGVWVRDLPLTPEKVLKAIKENAKI